MTSRSTHPLFKVFFAQGLGLGAAIGITYIPGLGVIAHYFQRRRALALGIAASVGVPLRIVGWSMSLANVVW